MNVRRFLAMTIAAMIGGALAHVSAQAPKPNFSGGWTMVEETFKPGDTLLMTGAMSIAQDDKTITVTFTIQGMGDIRTVYRLDGSESPNTLTMGGSSMVTMSKLKWDDNKLTITTSVGTGPQALETTMRWSLDASGNLLVVTTRPDFSAGGLITTKVAYKKKS